MSARRPLNTRLCLRVNYRDYGTWHGIAVLWEKPLSAIIRDTVNKYIASPPPPSRELDEVPFSHWARLAEFCGHDRSELRENYHYRKTIVLRLHVDELRRWKIAAQRDNRTVSAMIRRAVRHRLGVYEEIVRIFFVGKEEEPHE